MPSSSGADRKDETPKHGNLGRIHQCIESTCQTVSLELTAATSPKASGLACANGSSPWQPACVIAVRYEGTDRSTRLVGPIQTFDLK